MKLEAPTPQEEKRPSGIGLPWYWLTRPHPSITDIAGRRQAQLAASLTLMLALVNIIGGLAAAARTPESTMQVFGLPVAISLIAYLITRTRFVSFGSFLFVAGFCASGYLNIIADSRDIRVSILFYVPIGLTIGSALLSSWAIFLLTGLNVGATLFLLPALGVTLPENIGGAVGLVTAFGITLIILNNFRSGVERQRLSDLQNANQELLDVQSNLEERVAQRTTELNRRTTQMEAAAFVARASAEVRDLSGLLDNVVSEITDRFGFYHAGIFLADANEQYVILHAASSEGGKKMIERGHRLEIGRQGIVGYCAHQQRARIAQDVGADAVFFNNPDLPLTHSEMALPLITQNRLVGVLDIQSEGHNVFTSEDIATLQTMADQIALAIENARLIDESQSAIQQLQLLMTEKTTLSWKERESQQTRGFLYSPLGVIPIQADTNEISGAVPQTTGGRSIKVPISLRGKQIGVIALKRKSAEAPWTEAEQDMADKIAVQVALAVENARLLEESQKRAMREQTVNDLSSRFSRSLDVDTLLQNAVRELHRIPQVAEVSVFITPNETSEKTEQEA
jgi:GAF domain-containing protein